MKTGHGLKTLLLTLSLLFCYQAFSKTLQVDEIVPSVTNGDMTISRNGTGDIYLGLNSGFVKLTSGLLSEQALIDVTADITGILPVANGGTGSATQNFVDLTTAQTVGGVKNFSSEFLLDEIATPSNPSVGENKLYFKSDGNLYKLDDAGSEVQVGASAELSAKGNLFGFSTVTQECVLDKTDGKLLTVDATATCGFDFKDAPVSVTVDTKGDIQTHNATVPAKLAVGTDGSFLVADSAEATGIKWSDSITGLISQAHFVGSLGLSTDCVYTSGTGTTTYGKLTDPATCTATNTVGNVSQNTNVLEAGVKIPNFRTDGYYKIELQGLLFNLNNVDTCVFSLSKTTSYEDQGEVYLAVENRNRADNTLQGSFKFQGGDTGEVFVIARGLDTSGTCTLYGDSGNAATYNVFFYPDSTNLAAVQNKELTAETANELSASIAKRTSNGTETIVSTNYDWIDNAQRTNTGRHTINFEAGLFTEPPYCTCMSLEHPINCMGIANATTSAVTIFTPHNGTGTLSDAPYTISCSKQGADVNKSQVIAGTFENINSTDLTNITGKGNAAESITLDVTPISFYETKDNNNEWNNTTFTPSSGGRYRINGVAKFQSSNTHNLYLWVNRQGGGYTREQYAATSVTTNETLHPFKGEIDLSVGDTLQVRSSVSGTLDSVTSDEFHYITITQSADTESIIKNLNSNSNVECEKKYLSADITSNTSPIPDLTYTLVTGKTYKVSGGNFYAGALAANDTVSFISTHDSVDLDAWRITGTNVSGGTGSMSTVGACFVATNTSLTFRATSITSPSEVRGNNTQSQTYIELCKLPDNTICN